MPRLINELAELPEPVVLVLDDYHLLAERAPAPSRSPTCCATRRGRCSSRSPRAPIRRSRSPACARRASSWSVRAGELQFTGAETDALLNGSLALGLESADVELLQERTEGWPAGPAARRALAARPQDRSALRPLLRRRRPPGRRLPARGDRGRAARAARVPAAHVGARAHVRAAVRRGRRRRQRVAAARGRLPREPVHRRPRRPRPLVPLPPPVPRPAALRAAPASSPSWSPELHARAYEWHQAAGNLDEAISHASAAGLVDEARELIAMNWHGAWHWGPGTVARWVEGLPPGAIEGDARILLARGWSLVFSGRADEVEAIVLAAEQAPVPGEPRDEIGSVATKAALLRACVAYQRGDLERLHALGALRRRRPRGARRAGALAHDDRAGRALPRRRARRPRAVRALARACRASTGGRCS